MFLGRLKSFFLDITEVVVFAIAIFLFLYLLVLQPHKIKGASMEPNFHNGEYLLTDKVTYRFGEPERGDVIVFAAPPDETEDFIKRIIALPGEKMSVHEGFVFINGQRLNEIYLPNSLKTESGDFFKDGREIEVPQEHFVVLGDNRLFSSDSRSWGFITRDEIKGRAWIVYWPFSEAGLIKESVYSFN
ncbi:signal peptidase I [Candidatus Woesebacteria bacterium RBG_16_39_8b]|uniref:Signal peptidase I n=1 Tax=Candidatus Woesebacteria bacterium RBG_16_39_8b TaxID=1802482 RepID=A0A1F7XIG2_9BACT|nr:MAG: signal peptidase I [Candidatus Woesebacteria bacterium RBG_16_39_8b]